MREGKMLLGINFNMLVDDWTAKIWKPRVMEKGAIELSVRDAMELIQALGFFACKILQNQHESELEEVARLEDIRKKNKKKDEELDKRIERHRKIAEIYKRVAETFRQIEEKAGKALEEYDSIYTIR